MYPDAYLHVCMCKEYDESDSVDNDVLKKIRQKTLASIVSAIGN